MSHPQTIPFGRPREQTEVTARLRDGGLAALRPLAPGETGPLVAVFDGMSADSRALRYLTGLPRLPASMLSLLTAVDDTRHVAWLATVAGEPAGIARYVRDFADRRTAELAFEVTDQHHGRGLGTVLLDTITTVAAARGVRRVQATMAPSNRASRRLLERVGATTRMVDRLLEAEGSLRLLAPPVVDRAAVLALACGRGFERSLDIG